MTQKDVHFEIFRRNGEKDGWALHEVATVREKALAAASELMRAEKPAAVKVVKESYESDTGDYLSLRIFEDGPTKMSMSSAAEDMPSMTPCFRPEDLYSQHARATLTRLLRGFLGRHKITITELIHRADCLQKLEASGTMFQHAVQKIAVAQAAATRTPVQQIVKTLNDLATKAINRVYRDSRRNYFPVVKPGGFGALANKLAAQSDGSYVLNGALALHLAPTKSWTEKLLALFALMPEAPAEGPGRALFLGAIDNLVAELIGGSAALHELIGETENLGQVLLILIDVFYGLEPAGREERGGLVALAKQFDDDRLPVARAAISDRIIAELKNSRRLCPSSRLDELSMTRKIANKLISCDSRYMSREDLIVALTVRSRRLVTNEAIGEYLAEQPSPPDEKIQHLLRIAESIIGVENNRRLGNALEKILLSPDFEDYFITNSAPAMGRLRRLADLQARVRRANFDESQHQKFADCLDRIAHEVEQRGKVLRSLHESLPGPTERVLALLKLLENNVLTEGRLRTRAHALLFSQLSQPGFLAGYLAQAKNLAGPDAHDPKEAMSELAQMLRRAGISPEAGLKAVAA